MEEAHRELMEIEHVENERLASSRIGRAYRYRNSYSLPQTDADYWWSYVIVTGQRDGMPIGFEFQSDKDGLVMIRDNERVMAMWPGHSDGWEECTHAEARAAWEKIKARTSAAADRVFLVSPTT